MNTTNTPTSIRTEDFPVWIKLPVNWGEMDALGHVNNAVYFKYMESARMAYFERVGFWSDGTIPEMAPILAKAECEFIKALTYPDEIRIGARVSHIGNSSMKMEYLILNGRSEPAATGTAILVAFNYRTNEKISVPDSVRKKVSELELRPL